MKKYSILIFFLSFFTANLFATQFVPSSIESQVNEADFGVEATLKEEQVYKNPQGFIMTRFKFSIDESFGFNDKELILELVGGTFEGVTTFIDGAPSFEINKQFFLMLKKIESKIYLSNFTLGAYQVIQVDGQTFYRSEVFSHDAKIGMIKKEKMKLLWDSKFGISSNTKKKEIPVIVTTDSNLKTSPGKKQNRKPAENLKTVRKIYTLELILGLGTLIFGIGILLFMRKRKHEK
jgi:hypothetical protein